MAALLAIFMLGIAPYVMSLEPKVQGGLNGTSADFLASEAKEIKLSKEPLLKFRRKPVSKDFNEVIEAYDYVNGRVQSGKELYSNPDQTDNYECSGLCCSSKPPSIPSKNTKTMLSRWLTNAMFNNSRVHIWSWRRNSYWGPQDKNLTNWTGRLTAFSGQPLRSATNSIRIIRVSASTVRLMVPGGGYVEATAGSKVFVNPKPVRGTLFTFLRVGSSHVRFVSIFGTYMSLGINNYLYHFKVQPSDWETFLIYEVVNVPAYRGVNLGHWLFPEAWMDRKLWSNTPNYTDGHILKFKSIKSGLWGRTVNGTIMINVDDYNKSDRYVIRRVGAPNGKILLRNTKSGLYHWVDPSDNILKTQATIYPKVNSQFTLYLNPYDMSYGMLKAYNGYFIRELSDGRLKADVPPSSLDLSLNSTWNGSTALILSYNGTLLTPYQLCSGISRRLCNQIFHKHWSSYITEIDWKWIRDQRLNAVRLPIGYWITQGEKPDYPFPAGGSYYLDWAFQMAAKYKIRIFISMHSAPGSNNRLESRDGFFEFGLLKGSVEKMLNAIRWVAQRYGSHPMFSGIGLINEPYVTIPQGVFLDFYRQGTAIVRKYSQCSYIAFSYRYGYNPYEYKLFPSFPKEASNVIQDQHLYKNYHKRWINKTVDFIVQDVVVNDKNWLQYIESNNYYITMVGEFSNALHKTVKATKGEVSEYAVAQLQTYSKYTQGGWFFWSYKGIWSFKYAVENNIVDRVNGEWP